MSDTMKQFEKEVEVSGHLIDSLVLTQIFNKIMDLKGEFEVLDFKIGKSKTDSSYIKLLVKGSTKKHLHTMLDQLHEYGAGPVLVGDVQIQVSPKDMVVPETFYSTTHHPTEVYHEGRWLLVDNPMMDKLIVIRKDRAVCQTIREIKKGDLIVVGTEGIRVKPPERPRAGLDVFEFMSSKASTEKPIPSIAKRIAEDFVTIKKSGGKIAVVAGPAVVHTGAADSLSKLIKGRWIDVILAGNALAVHDVEHALYGTSLGVDVLTATSTAQGHRNHMAAINEIFRAGSLAAAVKNGKLRSGIMYECIENNVPYVLAGSLRDDGPIPDVITDVVEAQIIYKDYLKNVDMVVMLCTMLHSIAVGNMIPSTVKVVAVDINPSTVTKLLDRGTGQALGVVSDVGAFLPLLVGYLDEFSPSVG